MGKRGREQRGPPRKFDDRQARKQAERMETDGKDQGDFNIWYGPRKKRRGTDKAPSRCNAGLDAGATRGSEAGALEFCVFFARGSCARGYSCHKLHFIPTQEDDAREDNTHDCFGRERSGVEDDNDRDGVGCFLKENRTLWAGGVPVLNEASTRERVRRNFGEWGRINSVRLVKNKSCAFIQYAYRASAEFAKEAMSNQTLLVAEAHAAADQGRSECPGRRRPSSSSSTSRPGEEAGTDGPVLHVRWASEDPNPAAVLRSREGHAQTLLAAQVASGALPKDVAGRLPGADRALLRKMGFDPNNPTQVDLEFQQTQRQYLALQGGGADDHYPNTDHQYPATDHQYPNTSQLYPNTNHQYPSADHQYPSTDQHYPRTDHQYPSTDHQHPNTDHQYPNSNQRYLNAGNRYRQTDQRYTTDGQEYTTDGNAKGTESVGNKYVVCVNSSVNNPSVNTTAHDRRAQTSTTDARRDSGFERSDIWRAKEGNSSSARTAGETDTASNSIDAQRGVSSTVDGGSGLGKGDSGRVQEAGVMTSTNGREVPKSGSSSLSLLGGYGSDDSD